MKDAALLAPPIWVDTATGFGRMLDRLQGEPAVALDTESNSLYAYREQVCLVQLSVPSADYLVDPLALRDLAALGPLLADPRVLKVLHGAEYDLSVLHRDYQFVVASLFDTMWASRILGWPEHGLAALLQTHFGVNLDKRYQRANWGVRPLPPEQLDYARLDTHFLLPLQRLQLQALEAAKRWPQARHRFDALTQTRWEPKGFDSEGFWRLRGVRDLDDVGRGVLRALYLCRDRCARAKNRPPFKVLSNQALLVLSQHRPQTAEALRHIPGLPHRWLSQYTREVLESIREGTLNPVSNDQRPRLNNGPKYPTNGRPSAECQARFDALRAWRNETAERRSLEPDIILTNQNLWAVACRNPRQHADLSRSGLLASWQIEEYGDDLLAVLATLA